MSNQSNPTAPKLTVLGGSHAGLIATDGTDFYLLYPGTEYPTETRWGVQKLCRASLGVTVRHDANLCGAEIEVHPEESNIEPGDASHIADEAAEAIAAYTRELLGRM
jgi:hypothetical protein